MLPAVNTNQFILPEAPTPRWYQREAANAPINYFLNGGTGHPLIVGPTGCGKTHIIGDFCRQVLCGWPSEPVLLISHSKDILEQDHDTLIQYVPPELVGIYSAGLKSRQRNHFTIAGVQSIAKRAELFSKASLILVDEAHRIPPSQEGQYAEVFKAIPHAKVIGLTATPFRLKSGFLHEGDGALFDKIVYDIDIVTLIDQGWLCPLISKDPASSMQTEGLHTRQGDFITTEMSEQLDREEITQAIIAEMLPEAKDYNSWLVFAIDIKHAHNIAWMLYEKGIRVGIVHSKMKDKHNAETKRAFKNGELQALVSVETLTTGFDYPAIDLIALLRPTKSPVLHIQMIGRGLRIDPSKTHCKVLDFAGNINRLGPINDVHVADKRTKKKGNPIVKTCPNCRAHNYGSAKTCSVCGFEFIFKEKIKTDATTSEVIKKKKEKIINWFTVTKVTYSEHTSKTLNKTLKVTYYCGIRFFHDWVALESKGYVLHQAKHWWNYRSKESDLMSAPESIGEAVYRANEGELYEPKRILVDETEKYPRIKQCEFDD